MPSVSLLAAGTTIWRSGLPPFFSTPFPPPAAKDAVPLCPLGVVGPPASPAANGAPLSPLPLPPPPPSLPVAVQYARAEDDDEEHRPEHCDRNYGPHVYRLPHDDDLSSPGNDVPKLLAAAVVGPGGLPSYS
jgi:hypothetical protein